MLKRRKPWQKRSAISQIFSIVSGLMVRGEPALTMYRLSPLSATYRKTPGLTRS
jgi:hypothetical protein